MFTVGVNHEVKEKVDFDNDPEGRKSMTFDFREFEKILEVIKNILEPIKTLMTVKNSNVTVHKKTRKTLVYFVSLNVLSC